MSQPTLEDAIDTLMSRWENTFNFIGDHSDDIVEEFRGDLRKLITAWADERARQYGIEVRAAISQRFFGTDRQWVLDTPMPEMPPLRPEGST